MRGDILLSVLAIGKVRTLVFNWVWNIPDYITKLNFEDCVITCKANLYKFHSNIFIL